ncbi:hypothetical protein BBAD15_g2407 [Beauveria bassiana D1-5]|uniref:Tachykinin family protein n=1 Tax=Beauveria bassiana D1-5 TaxID=1245745 RepID=A0A0A2VV89_BEABA|nr:hypothetical protein BBAD15_g2407 [Beauveria bassiana D1-5]
MSAPVNSQSTTGAGDFQFITESNSRELRSHAMKSHWRMRKQRASGRRSAGSGSQPRLQPLRPRVHHSHVPAIHQANRASDTKSSTLTSYDQLPSMGDLTRATSEALCSAMGTLSGGRLDPFDSLPVRLASVHHRLLYHWLSTSATTTLSHLPASIFNTARDVWLPLDLSNAASFNICMAHAAAHLARIHGRRCSTIALRFKVEAMRIISEWIQNEAKALSDDMFAAVLRLLTYERQWGTESDWQVHRHGLRQMLGARGGVEALASNGRLALVAFLTTLVVRQTWFDCSNHISGLLAPQSLYTLSLITGDESAATRLRCLWFLSLSQDMEHFVLHSMETKSNILANYPHLQDALLLLLVDIEEDEINVKADGHHGADMSDGDFRRLACVFFIAILYRSSIMPPLEASSPIQGSYITCPSALFALNAHLSEYCDTWRWDVEGLYITLFTGFSSADDGIPDRDYVLGMISILRSLTCAARHGIESCLLHIGADNKADPPLYKS